MNETYAQRDALLQSMGFATYGDYLTSSLWSDIRARAYRTHGANCNLCETKATVIHHLSYCQSALLGDDLNQLVPLCDECHCKVEFTEEGEKRTLFHTAVAYRRLSSPTVKREHTSKRCSSCNNEAPKKSKMCARCKRRTQPKKPVRCSSCNKNWANNTGKCRPCSRTGL